MDNKVLVKVKADITDLNQKLDSAGKNLDKWSKDTMGGFTSLAKGIGTATLRFAAMTAPITATGAAIFAMMQKTANTGEELLRMKQKTGLTVEELYNLKQVAEFSDVSLGEMGVSLKTLSVNLVEARGKAGEARDIFKALGIDTSKSLNQVLIDLAKRFADMEDGEGKLSLVTQLFGRNAQDIIPVLNDLASGAHNVSGAFSEKAAKSASEFNDNITELKQNLISLRDTMANVLIPVVNDFFKPRPKSGTLEDIDEQIKRTRELIALREKWANPEDVRDMLNELAKLEDKRAFTSGLFEDDGVSATSAKSKAPAIVAGKATGEKSNAKEVATQIRDLEAAYKNMYEALKFDTEKYYTYQKGLLEKRRNEEIAITGDLELAWEAYYARLQELEEQRILRTDDFAGGIKAYYAELSREGFTWAQGAKGMMQDFASGGASALSNFARNVETDFGNAGQHVKTFARDMSSSVLSAINDMIAKWIMMKIIMGIGNAISGGMGGLSGVSESTAAGAGAWSGGAEGVMGVRGGPTGPRRMPGSGGGLANYSITIQNSFLDPSGIEKYETRQKRQIENTIKQLQHENRMRR